MNGIINFLKPPGITSSDAVVDFKRLLGIKRVGHAGTLDPAAAGVLPITIGRGTRLFDYLLGGEKVYVGEILLGVSTDTFDTCGTVVSRVTATVSSGVIMEQMAKMTGDILQTPPMYSAVRFEGKKLYQLARKGQTASVAPRPVTVHAFELLDMIARDRVRFRVRCSKGTYVRVLAHDLGTALGCGACLSLLVRTQNGSFSVEDSLTLPQIRMAYEKGEIRRFLIPPDQPLMHYAAVSFHDDAEAAFRNGMMLPLSLALKYPGDFQGGELVRLYCGAAFLGLARIQGDAVRIHRFFT